MSFSDTPYKRVLLKLSGEALISPGSKIGIEPGACQKIAQSIKSIYDLKVQIGIVIGGGNLVRGHEFCTQLNMPKAKADQVGMLATLMNGITLQRVLLNVGCETVLMSSFPCGSIAEPFNLDQALEHLNQGQIVIFAGGTGNPFFTTDTAASLRACEIQAEVLLKATKVDGIYNEDPKQNPNAKKIDSLTYQQVLEQNLKVMDASAISLCSEHQIPIVVFNMYQEDNMKKVIEKHPCGTIVKGT